MCIHISNTHSKSLGHGDVMCVAGVAVSSGLGPALVVQDRWQYGVGVTVQGSTAKLPASSFYLCGYHVPRERMIHQRCFSRIPHLRSFLSYNFAEPSETAPRQIDILKRVICRVYIAGKPQKHALIVRSTMYSYVSHDRRR